MFARRFANSISKYAFSEKKNFFESITSSIKGYLNPNTIQEHNPKLSEQEKTSMKRFLIYRYNPNDPRNLAICRNILPPYLRLINHKHLLRDLAENKIKPRFLLGEYFSQFKPILRHLSS